MFSIMENVRPAGHKSRKKHRKDKGVEKMSFLSRRSNSLSKQSIKSFGAVIPKSWKDSFQKKDHVNTQRERKGSNGELSTEESAPGVLKLFGTSVIPGTQYKSVLATQTSSAQELVKEALERYGIPKGDSRQYALCDVIGIKKEEGTADKPAGSPVEAQTWTEECVRVIGDDERPLTLQLFWKPTEGFSRRFEIRKRYEIISVNSHQMFSKHHDSYHKNP